jgi:hypothetical protein
MHNCTSVFGYSASMASGNPFSPSTQAMKISFTPRFFSSVRTCSQNFARSCARPRGPPPRQRIVGGRRDRLAGCRASARHCPPAASPTRPGPRRPRALPAPGQPPIGPPPSPSRRVPFPPTAALPCRLRLQCPLARPHLVDPLQHLILRLKL